MSQPSVPGYNIRNLNVSPGLVLAPMSGVTSSAFRRLIKRLNPNCVGLTISEFISVEGMTRGGRRSLEMMRFAEEERPFGIQIFGYDIERMVTAAKMVQDSGVDVVDINCGCPAPKVVRRGGGCELMRQPGHLKNLFREVRKAVSIPLTMKMRSGWDEESKNAVEIGKIAEGEGVEAITVHGRTRAQLYRGEADWTVVQKVADAVSVPVCGSGDVVDFDSAQQRLIAGVKGLYIGRASIANPFVFTEIATSQKHNLKTEPLLVLSIVESYIAMLLEETSEKAALGKVKQLVSRLATGYEWRKDICRSLKLAEVRTRMEGLVSDYRAAVTEPSLSTPIVSSEESEHNRFS